MTTKLSQLETIESLEPSASVPVVQGGVTVRASVAQFSGLPGVYSVKAYGAVGNGTTDDRAAILAAITAAGNGVVYFPPGTYRIASTLTIARRVHLLGAGGIGKTEAGVAAGGSILLFDQGFGLVMDSSAVGSGSTKGSVVEHIYIKQGGTSEAGSTNAVTQYARCVWRGCTIEGFGGHGWYVPTALGNEVTESAWYDCHVTNCDRPWDIQTGNSIIIGGTAYSCRSGFRIANVFGCTVVGLKLRDVCPAGIGFQLSGPVGDEDGQGQHIAVGCGVSGGNGNIRLGAASVWTGGPDSVGFTDTSSGLRIRRASDVSPHTVKYTKGGVTMSRSVGIESTSLIWDQFEASGLANEMRDYYDNGTANQLRRIMRHMARSQGFMEVTLDSHVEGTGYPMFPLGQYVGNGADRRYFTTGAAAPTGASQRVSGNWEVGDVVWNSAPTAGGTAYWQCTTAGNPGTWTARS